MQNINISSLYKILDAYSIFLSCSIAYYLRFNTFLIPTYYLFPTIILLVVALLSLSATGIYDKKAVSDFTHIANSTALGLVIAALMTTMLLYLTKTGHEYSRIWLTYSVVSSIALILISRLLLRKIIKQSTGQKYIILLGENTTANEIDETLTNNKHITLAERFPSKSESTLLAAKLIEEHRRGSRTPISEVWVTSDFFELFNHLKLTSDFHNSSIRIVYIPEIPKLFSPFLQNIDFVDGIPTINSDMSSQQKLQRLFKLVEDKTIAIIGMLTALPLMLIISVLIKLDSSGPIFYKQKRYGIHGKNFLVWKFRTMYVTETTNEFQQAKLRDPRVTRLGGFLRRTFLDELPQLFNVLNGTMSIVGPRPHPVLLNEQYRSEINGYMSRHHIKPGMTGLAQVHGFRGETPKKEDMEKRIAYDLDYVYSWSVLLDFKIIIKTVRLVLSRKNEH